MSAETTTLARIKRGALKVLGDSDNGRWKCRFDIASQSSDDIYRVSFDSAPGAGYWVCSCFGYRRWGGRKPCKHLRAMGLPGRDTGKSLKWVKHFQLAERNA